MKIKDLWCKHGSVWSRWPVAHYMKAECENPMLPFSLAREILTKNEEDKQHRGLKITITRAMACPLQIVLDDEFEHTVNLFDLLAAQDGTHVHERIARNAPPDWYTEITFPKSDQEGLFGVKEFGGTADLVRSDFSAIEEYKTSGEFSHRYKWKKLREGEQFIELDCQMNMQRLLIAQHTGADIQRMLGWHGCRVGADGPPAWFRTPVGRMSEAEIAESRCFGSNYTVKQNISFIRGYREHRAQGVSREAAARRIPTAGRTMFNGKKCDLYCTARERCDEIQGGA